MTSAMIHGQTLEAWCASHPLIRDLVALRDGLARLAEHFAARTNLLRTAIDAAMEKENRRPH